MDLFARASLLAFYLVMLALVAAWFGLLEGVA